jgi:hypothetical protein
MAKPLIWIGALVAVIGAGAIALFVTPYAGINAPSAGLGDQVLIAPLAAVLSGGAALAAGFAMIGVGIGRWQHPRGSHTLQLGQTPEGKEV